MIRVLFMRAVQVGMWVSAISALQLGQGTQVVGEMEAFHINLQVVISAQDMSVEQHMQIILQDMPVRLHMTTIWPEMMVLNIVYEKLTYHPYSHFNLLSFCSEAF